MLTIVLTVRSFYKINLGTAPDFSVFYYTTHDLLAGKNPYLNKQIFTGLGYPVNTLLFYIPLASFKLKTAQVIYLLFSLTSIIASVWFSMKIINSKSNIYNLFLAISLTLLSFPSKFTLGMGQNNGVALFLLLLSFYFYKKSKIPISGILLGVAISLKTLFVFFVVFYFLKKKWKLLIWTSIPIIISILLIILIHSLDIYWYWLTQIIPPLFNTEGGGIYYNQGFLGTVSRFINLISLRRPITLFLNLSVLLITIKSIITKKNNNLLFSLTVITLLLIDSLSWQHHFIWLIFPFIAITHELIKTKRTKQLIWVALAYLLVSWNFKHPEIFQHFPQNLILSHVFYGTLILYFLNLKLLRISK